MNIKLICVDRYSTNATVMLSEAYMLSTEDSTGVIIEV